jgi:hypothetical protein
LQGLLAERPVPTPVVQVEPPKKDPPPPPKGGGGGGGKKASRINALGNAMVDKRSKEIF